MFSLSGRTAPDSRSMIRPTPLGSLRQEMEELFDRLSGSWNGEPISELQIPSTDISETDGNIEVTMDVPGMKASELTIEVRGNILEVSGEHQEEKEEKDKTYRRVERRRGAIRRAFVLPAEVDESKVSAECKDGVLHIVLPKSEEAKKQRIEVKG